MLKPKLTKQPYSKIRLLSKRLEIRPYRISDFKTLQESHKNRTEQINKFDDPIPVSKESNYEKHKKRLKRFQTHGKEESLFVFGIFDRKNGSYIGQLDFFTINKQLRWGNIGYHIQNQYFKKGYATEAGKIGLKGAFKLLGFHRIEAAMEINNIGSQKVAINLGLKFEGKRLKFFPDKGGIDMMVFASNAMDYKA